MVYRQAMCAFCDAQHKAFRMKYEPHLSFVHLHVREVSGPSHNLITIKAGVEEVLQRT